MDESVPQYVRDLAANLQKNSLGLAYAVLRYDSVEGLDLIALMATHDTMGYRRTLESARALLNGELSVKSARELFDPLALSSLARLLAGRPGDELDFTESADLYRAVRLVRGDVKLSLDAGRLEAQTNLAAGNFDYVEGILPALGVDDDTRWMVETELLNPIYGRPGSTMVPWLESFNRLFQADGLLPISIPEEDGEPFDRITTNAPDMVSAVDQPLVTIIMSTFEPDGSLRGAVQSLLKQTWRNLEILVVDDCSPSAFDAILHEAEALDDRVELLRMAHNGGTYKIRNFAMARAKGEFVGFQDSDDWSHPERIERQMAPLLERDECLASMSRAARVTSDMRSSLVGYGTLRQNASSLLFRRRHVLAKLGGYDEVRKAADSEFIHRIETVFGEESIEEVRLPLALVQLTGSSLSRSDFRFGWHHGARVAYREAYSYWHKLIERGQESPFLDPAAERRFVAPMRFLNKGEPASVECDVLLVSDWRSGIGRYFGAAREVEALSEAGLSMAVAQAESIRFALRRREAPTESIMELRASGMTKIALWNEGLHARLVMIRDPELLNFPRAADTVKLRADRLVMVAGYPCRTPESGWLTYDPALVEKHAFDMFGIEPEWLPAHNGIADSLRAGGAACSILAPRSVGVVPLRRKPFTGLRGAGRPIVGTTGFEHPQKDRPSLESLRQLLPDYDNYDVRIRASTEVIGNVLNGEILPPNWLVLDENDPSEFFGQLDFFVGVPMRSWGSELSWAAIEAMAHGCVAILDPAYEEHFGAAAIYTGSRSARDIIDQLTNNPVEFSRQQERGYDFCAGELSSESYSGFMMTLAGLAPQDSTVRDSAHQDEGSNQS